MKSKVRKQKPVAVVTLAESTGLAEATVKLPADFDLQTARQKVQSAIDAQYPAPTNNNISGWNDIVQLTISSATWNCNGDIWQCTWEFNPMGEIQLGAKEKVKVTYVTAESSARVRLREEFEGSLSEASSQDNGWTWKLRVLRSGRTITPNADLSLYGLPGKAGYKNYLAEAVRNAAPFFENVPFVVRSTKDHLGVANGGQAKEDIQKAIQRVAGMVHGVSVSESNGVVEVFADLTLKKTGPGPVMREKFLAEAAKPGGLNYGVSYTGIGDGYIEDFDSVTPTLVIKDITQVDSVDPCLKGNAGGRVIAAAEAALVESASHLIKKESMTLTAKQRMALLVRAGALSHKFPKLLSATALAEAAEEDSGGGGEMDGDAILQKLAEAYLKDTPLAVTFLKDADGVLSNPDGLKAMDEWLDTKLGAETPADDDETAEVDATGEPKGTAVAEAAKKHKVGKQPLAESVQLVQANDRIAKLEAANMANLVEVRLGAVGSSLTPEAKARIRKEFSGRLAESAEIDTSIRDMKKLLGGVSTSSALAESIDFTQGEDANDKMRKGVTEFFFRNAPKAVLAEAAKSVGFDPVAKENHMWTSFKAMYQDCIGASRLDSTAGFGGQYKVGRIQGGRLAEEASTGILTQLIQDALHHRMVSEYRNEGDWDFYKLVSTPVPVVDFREYHDQHFGYVSNPMQVIQEDTDYPEIPLTGNEDIGTTLVERGGIFGIGWRAVLNDDVGFVVKIAPRLAMGAKKQLAKGVGNIFLNAFTTPYGPDGVSIIDPSGSDTPGVNPGAHNNYLGRAAINAAGQMALAEQLFAMQPELGGGDAMGLTPDYLLYAPTQRKNAYPILTPGQGSLTSGNPIGIQGVLVATADQSVGLRGLKVPYWNDSNNAYFVVPDQSKIEYIHVVYLNGQEEPQIFQEVVNSGWSFTRKRMQLRFEHHWQTNCVDFRGITGGHVS